MDRDAVKNAVWGRPTKPGAYWVTGYSLDEPERVGLVEVIEYKGSLWSNIHAANTDDPAEQSWHPLDKTGEMILFCGPLETAAADGGAGVTDLNPDGLGQKTQYPYRTKQADGGRGEVAIPVGHVLSHDLEDLRDGKCGSGSIYRSPCTSRSHTDGALDKTVPVYTATPAPSAGVDGSSPEVEAFLSEVRAELIRARSKFPGDRIMTIALAEEFGELCKAVLDESAANVRKEAVQTAVMAARVVLDGDGSVREWRASKGLDPLAPSTEGQRS